MTPEVQAFASGFPLTLLHAGLTLLFLALGVALYAVLSPHKEVQLIRQGNAAATLSLAGVVLGLGVPLAAALAASPSILEIALWAAAVLFVQLVVFRLIDALLAGLPQRMQEGDIPAAVLLTSAKLSAALVLAAAVAG
jgi:putative membrane protein